MSGNSIRSDCGSKVWRAQVLYNTFRRFLRIFGARLRDSNAYEEQRYLAHPVGDGRTITNPMDDVDEGLGVLFSETADHIGRLLAREY